MPIHLEWDDTKNLSNRRKHGISFEVATRVFRDPLHISVQDRSVDGEERWQTIGLVERVALLLVAHTFRESEGEEIIRIFSARRATAQERRRYENEDR